MWWKILVWTFCVSEFSVWWRHHTISRKHFNMCPIIGSQNNITQPLKIFNAIEHAQNDTKFILSGSQKFNPTPSHRFMYATQLEERQTKQQHAHANINRLKNVYVGSASAVLGRPRCKKTLLRSSGQYWCFSRSMLQDLLLCFYKRLGDSRRRQRRLATGHRILCRFGDKE